jgi:hypothetical protein
VVARAGMRLVSDHQYHKEGTTLTHLVDSTRNSFILLDMARKCYLRTIPTVDVLAILPPVSQTDSARTYWKDREEDACNQESPFAAAVVE